METPAYSQAHIGVHHEKEESYDRKQRVQE
jgi:hypothetical protein